MKRKNIILLLFLLVPFLWISCEKKISPTSVEVQDPNRHYYPILQGQELDINYQILNTGKSPLVISEVQASCGCIIVNEKFPIIIFPKKLGGIKLQYNSTKNVGLVRHYIRAYGNFVKTGMLELQFDVNVVPDADYTRDYEELYREQQMKNGAVKDAVDGNEAQRGYYVTPTK